MFSVLGCLTPLSQMYLTGNPATNRTTRGHDQKFQMPFSRILFSGVTYFVSSPIKGILEIKKLIKLTPGAYRWIFWHGRIVSDQVQVRFYI
jgi:hypothetical protein